MRIFFKTLDETSRLQKTLNKIERETANWENILDAHIIEKTKFINNFHRSLRKGNQINKWVNVMNTQLTEEETETTNDHKKDVQIH